MARLRLCVLLLPLLGLSVRAQVVEPAPPVIVIAEADVKSTIPDKYTKREQQSAAWACAELDHDAPANAYNNLQSYMNGANSENYELMKDVVLYPLQEYFSSDAAVKDNLCIYLQKEDHCYPPTPTTGLNIEIMKQFDLVIYYDVRYWGQSSTARTEHYATQLKQDLDEAGESYDERYHILSYFPNHVRELRVDVAAAASPGTDVATTGSTCENSDLTSIEGLGCVLFSSENTYTKDQATSFCEDQSLQLFTSPSVEVTGLLSKYMEDNAKAGGHWVGGSTGSVSCGPAPAACITLVGELAEDRVTVDLVQYCKEFCGSEARALCIDGK